MRSVSLDQSLSASRLEIRVRFCETDLMGIVHHGNYLAYMEAGRVDWLRKRGVTYADWAMRGLHLPVVEASVLYRAPARFDDMILVETALIELRAATLRYAYRIVRGDMLLAEGTTRLANVNDHHKPSRFTQEMMSVLTSGEKTVR
jgi:acyl-CoA thioester hydrolase